MLLGDRDLGVIVQFLLTLAVFSKPLKPMQLFINHQTSQDLPPVPEVSLLKTYQFGDHYFVSYI